MVKVYIIIYFKKGYEIKFITTQFVNINIFKKWYIVKLIR
jgi:hypothetical protein